jgi:hypothetical protein
VEVGHGLTSIWTGVHDDAKAALGVACFFGKFGADEHQAAEQGCVLGYCFAQTGDVTSWDDELVEGRLGADVRKGQHFLVAKGNGSWDLAVADPAK